ncbi:MAG: sulfurtransferase TusA family protein [Alphaproteobacteria bacterium]|nr:MAG: sulfurtransferase TusA family protein [Alphaproteobacteria bacterium]
MTTGTNSLDLRHEVCPMTFVRTKLALERLEPGRTLTVVLGSAESAENVPASAREQGYLVLSVKPVGDGLTEVTLARSDQAAARA